MALIAQYLFDNNANDSVGTYNGTATDVSFENSPLGYNFGQKAAVFNGTSSRINLPNISPIAGTNARSFEFWACPITNATDSWRCVFGYGPSTVASGTTFGIYLPTRPSTTGGLPGVDLYDYRVVFGNLTGLDQWHHYVFTCPANGLISSIKMYRDGQEVAIDTSKSVGITNAVNTSNANFSIGYRASTSSLYYCGKLANLRVYDAVLTAQEVQSHYQQDTLAATVNNLRQDYRRNRNTDLVTPIPYLKTSPIAHYLFNNDANDETGTYNGTPSNVTYEDVPAGYNFGGKVAVFNGTSSKIDLPNISPIAGTAAKTFSFWRYSLAEPSDGWSAVFAFGTASNGNCLGLFTPVPTLGNSNVPTIDIYAYHNSFGNRSCINEWHHLTFVFNPNTNLKDVICYIDGVRIGSNYTDDVLVNPTNNDYGFGYRKNSNNHYCPGKIANFRIYNQALSQQEILVNYKYEKGE